jgi:hypothetical protein
MKIAPLALFTVFATSSSAFGLNGGGNGRTSFAAIRSSSVSSKMPLSAASSSAAVSELKSIQLGIHM